MVTHQHHLYKHLIDESCLENHAIGEGARRLGNANANGIIYTHCTTTKDSIVVHAIIHLLNPGASDHGDVQVTLTETQTTMNISDNNLTLTFMS